MVPVRLLQILFGSPLGILLLLFDVLFVAILLGCFQFCVQSCAGFVSSCVDKNSKCKQCRQDWKHPYIFTIAETTKNQNDTYIETWGGGGEVLLEEPLIQSI